MSIGATASTSPVKPPMVNTKMKPMANSIGVSKVMDPRHMVAVQLKTLTPVGMEISIVPYMKNSWAVTGMPVVNMWCAHTRNDRMAMAQMRSEERRVGKEGRGRRGEGDDR